MLTPPPITFVQRFLFFDHVLDYGFQQRLWYGGDGRHEFVDQVVDAERIVRAHGVLEVVPKLWKKRKRSSIDFLPSRDGRTKEFILAFTRPFRKQTPTDLWPSTVKSNFV